MLVDRFLPVFLEASLYGLRPVAAANPAECWHTQKTGGLTNIGVDETGDYFARRAKVSPRNVPEKIACNQRAQCVRAERLAHRELPSTLGCFIGPCFSGPCHGALRAFVSGEQRQICGSAKRTA